MKIFRAFCLSASLVLIAAQGVTAAVVRPIDCIPPVDSQYIGVLQQFHQGWPIGSGHIEFSNPIHKQFSNCTSPPTAPGSTTHTFSSTLTGILTTNGINPVPFTAPADVSVLVTFESLIGNVLELDTQITQFDVAAGNVVLRQSLQDESFGHVTIVDLSGPVYGPGPFLITSFFDVFTELSIDGGPFVTSDTAGHVILVDTPEPSAMFLMVAGGIVVAVSRRMFRSFPSRGRA